MTKKRGVKMPLKSAKILNTTLNSTFKYKVLEEIIGLVKAHTKFYVVTPNPEIIITAQKDKDLRKALNSADFSLPDGIGLIFVGNLLGITPKLNLIKGRELMVALFQMAEDKGLKVFLHGSTKKVIKASLKNLRKIYPTLKAKGVAGANYNQKGEPATDFDTKIYIDTLNRINKFQPDLLFVALGAPKQEKWIAKNLPKLKIGGAMGVGGALDYFSGVKPLPPRVLADLGLEWFWRALNEPGHFKRAFRAVVIFPFLVIKEKMASYFSYLNN